MFIECLRRQTPWLIFGLNNQAKYLKNNLNFFFKVKKHKLISTAWNHIFEVWIPRKGLIWILDDGIILCFG